MINLEQVGLLLNAEKTVVLTNAAQPPPILATNGGIRLTILQGNVGQKWLGCMLTAAGSQSQIITTGGFYWTEAFPFPNANFFSFFLRWFHLSRALAAGTVQSTTPSWLFSMFIFEKYADQSLDRRRRLIGMRLGTRFFIYGMNGSGVL